MRCAVYLRGSADESDTSHQRYICLEYARREGYVVLEVYDEGGGQSGRKIHREKFDAMLRRIAEQKDVDVLLLYKTDRALRKAKELLELKSFCEQHGVILRAATQPIQTDNPEGKAFFTVGGAFAELEADFASVRIRDAYHHILGEHGTRPSVSWRSKDKPMVARKWGRPPGSKDKTPRKRRWWKKPAEAASPLETISVSQLQGELKSLDAEIAGLEHSFMQMAPGVERDRVLDAWKEKRQKRDMLANVITEMVVKRRAPPPKGETA